MSLEIEIQNYKAEIKFHLQEAKFWRKELKKVDLNFFCDGRFIGSAIKMDGKGQKLKSFEIVEEIIPTNKYFLMGTNPKSYDSRYYGYIDEKDIIGVTYGLI